MTALLAVASRGQLSKTAGVHAVDAEESTSERWLRVLEVLVELCAHDEQLRQPEVVLLRQTEASLGPGQDDHYRLLAAHAHE